MVPDGVVITEAEAEQAREFRSVLHDLIVLEEACEAALHEYAQRVGRQAALELDALILGDAEAQKGTHETLSKASEEFCSVGALGDGVERAHGD